MYSQKDKIITHWFI